MNLILHLVLCGVLLLATIGVALYRKWLEDHCDNYIHLHNDSHDVAVVDTQAGLCKRLEAVGKLQKLMIAATILYAVVIVGVLSYQAWNAHVA
jgi:hypothetical protein